MNKAVAEIVPFMSERGKALKGKLLPLSDIRPNLSANYLVRGWLGTGCLSVLYGPSNSGKTFVTLDLAMHVASGTIWRGQKVKPGPVVYVAAEGGLAIRNRVAAIRRENSALAANADFHLLPTHLDLHGTDDAMELCAVLPTKHAALIVIDTMARNMGAGDENSARDIAQFVANLDAIRERTGAHVLVVHHSGKKEKAGARGSSALQAAVDTEIMISDRQIACTKQRDMEMPDRLFFDLQSAELGQDQDGDLVTSAIVVPAAKPAKPQRVLKGRDKVAKQALSDALRAHGQKRSGDHFPQNRNLVSLVQWRDQCRDNGLYGPEASSDAQRKAFTRAKENLIKADHIRIQDDYVWII